MNKSGYIKRVHFPNSISFQTASRVNNQKKVNWSDKTKKLFCTSAKLISINNDAGRKESPEYCEKYLKKMDGPVVFGEIAYQLLNRTTVYVTIDVPLHTESK